MKGRPVAMPPVRGMSALWHARPRIYSRGAWFLMFALDVLPWPWGEHAFSLVFVLKAFVRPRRLRRALAWATSQRVVGWRRWRLALSTCAYHGRFLARQALVGIRTPEDFARHVVVRGEEHLAALRSGAVLLGFHVGAPCVSVALRLAGYPVTWVGGWRFSRAWANPAWQRFIEATPDIPIAESAGARGGTLYLARRRVMDGGMLYVAAEGYGREAFRIALPGCVARIRSGWLVLRRQSDVPVLPVLSHLEGMTQVVTIQPPLPAPSRDLARDLDACRDVIATLLGDYVRRFPEQCYGYAFPPRVAARVEESSPLESRAALPVPGPARRPSEAIDG